ncbi:MAG: hypothetical protein OEW95_04045 [Candidatus Bathyarchaeota archaeon]|nr:hypothetical protein [Candidatus Bathyarchaeota archaeon]
MTIFMVETYVVKPEKQAEFMAFAKKFVEWKEKNAEKFKEAKSWRLFAQMLGGNFGGYVEVWEFENMAECEKWTNRIMQDKDFMTTLYHEFTRLIVPATHSVNIWNAVM